jgi:hypothetical protein
MYNNSTQKEKARKPMNEGHCAVLSPNDPLVKCTDVPLGVFTYPITGNACMP